MIVALEEDAKAKYETYIPKKQNPLEKVPSPVSVEETAQRLVGMLLGSTVKKEEQGKVHFSKTASEVQAVPLHDLTPTDEINQVEKGMEMIDKDLEELLTLGSTTGRDKNKDGSTLEQDHVSHKPVFASSELLVQLCHYSLVFLVCCDIVICSAGSQVEESHNLTKCTSGDTESRKELEDWLDEYLGD